MAYRNSSDCYLSKGAERLGSRKMLDSLLIAECFGPSRLRPGFSRSAICRFTRSISTINFFDSWSRSACLHILLEILRSVGDTIRHWGMILVGVRSIAYPILRCLPIPQKLDARTHRICPKSGKIGILSTPKPGAGEIR